MNESIIKSQQSAGLLLRDLREAYANATPVASLVLSPLIGRAGQIEQELRALLSALECKE